MSDRTPADLDPEIRAKCQRWQDACRSLGIEVGISQTYRSDAEQDADYAQGRTAPGPIITNAKAGESAHNCTLNGAPAAKAFDFYIVGTGGKLDWDANDPQWKIAIAMGEYLGMVSGSTWHMRDCPHFELKDWDKKA